MRQVDRALLPAGRVTLRCVIGLLEVLGWRVGVDHRQQSAAAPAPRDDRANERTGDTSSDGTDKVVAAHDAIAELLKKLPEDKTRDGLEPSFRPCARSTQVSRMARAAAQKAELASAAR
jgi:hypothetical protein